MDKIMKEALMILDQIEAHVFSCCACTMDPENVIELIEKLRNAMNDKDQWLVDQYNRNRLEKNHVTCPEDIPNGEFIPKGKQEPDGDYWFDKDDRKQRGE